MSIDSDPRQIVSEGYDTAADEYARWIAEDVIDVAAVTYRESFAALLRSGADVLDLGCGGGGPTTESLAQRFALTGVDISGRQIARSRERLPRATFVHADMTRFECEPAAFDGVVAFYSLIHLPYGELPSMITRIAGWLRPGGVFLASLSGREDRGEHFETAWLADAPMYWSGYPPEDSLRFLANAGLTVIESSVETTIETGDPFAVLWVLARRPLATSSS